MIKKKKVWLKYCYGGAMNQVYLNKNILLKIDKNSFNFEHNNKCFRIHSSVEGVFKNIAKSLKQ